MRDELINAVAMLVRKNAKRIGDLLCKGFERLAMTLARGGMRDESRALGDRGGVRVEALGEGGPVGLVVRQYDMALAQPGGVIDGAPAPPEAPRGPAHR